MVRPLVIVIGGPTASGKTDLAINLAKHYGTDIISADSRQCYREMNIGVAKPTPGQLKEVQHYFINSHSVVEQVTAATFENYALDAAASIFARRPVAIMVGGTGLYIRAFCSGLDNIPPVPQEVRQQVNQDYQAFGLSWLQEQVKTLDPGYWQQAEQQNPHRLLRALEVCLATGKSINTFRQGVAKQRPFDYCQFAIDIPRETLYERINNRVDAMMRDGLPDEVAGLQQFRHLKALQTVGYAELFRHIDGEYDLKKAVDEIKKNTRHYAKRQLTWFKSVPGTRWLPPESAFETITQEYPFPFATVQP